MNRITKTSLSVLMLLVFPIVVGVLIARFFDWNYAKPIVNDLASHALERPFSIRGDLSISWSRKGKDDGWKQWIPWPHVVAQDVIVGNPKWISSPSNFIAIGKIMFSADPISLLSHTASIPALVLESPEIHLLRNADGKSNWMIADGGGTSNWKIDLSHIVITNGIAQMDDDARNLHLHGNFETMLDGGVEGYGLVWKVDGKYRGESLNANGKAGELLDLRTRTMPYPIVAHIQYGKTRADLRGALSRLGDLASLDLQMDLAGSSMADIYFLSGITMPQTPAFNTAGRLTGMLGKQGMLFHYENFNGRVGSSDLTGSLEYRSTQLSGRQRPLLTGRVQSNLLLFKDLAPIIGADQHRASEGNASHQIHSSNKVLPTQEFSFERWHSIDVDVAFTGRKIVRDEHLPFDNLSTHIVLQDGVLSLLPLEFGVAGGKFASNIKLDGNGTSIKAELSASARRLKLNQLAPGFKPMQSSLGELNGDIKLSATGNSVAVLLGVSNGEINLLINQGTVSKLMLDEAGLNVANVLLTKLFGDKQVKLNCVAGDFLVTDGVMHARNFLIDTDESDIGMTGQVDLSNEKLDLTIKPENKKFRLVSLRSPIYLTGSFKEPIVSVDKKTIAMRAGGALALGVLSPFATMLPLVDVAPSKDSGCAQLIQEAKSKPQAPAPRNTPLTKNSQASRAN